MHTTKKYFPTNGHATILSLLTRFDFDSVSLHLTGVIFDVAKLYLYFIALSQL